MRRPVLIGGLVLAAIATAAFLSSSSSRKPSSSSALPSTKRLTYRYLGPEERAETLAIGPAVVWFDGAPIRTPLVGPHDPIPRLEAFRIEFHAALAPRRRTLPKGANPVNADAWSQAQYFVPTWLAMPNSGIAGLLTNPSATPIDEYGRTFPGHWGSPPSNLWDQTLGGLLKNPLFRSVAIAALIASGPAGMAAYGAYTLWQSRGQLTVKNLALQGARAYATSQCGEPCGAAFDYGVGVASGKRYDRAAEDVLLEQMDPAQRQAYQQGKASLKGKM